MRKTLALLAAVVALAVAAPAAAQPWMSINQRQAQLDARIDAGVRDGSLTRAEALQLRAQFRDLAILESRYRASGGGLDARERADLDRRFDALSERIRTQRRDAQARPGPGGPGGAAPWLSINQRQAQLDARIDAGVRDGSLTRAEALQLRAEFRDIAALEARYRASQGGLSRAERADLDRRFDALSARIRIQRTDAQKRPGPWMSINQRQAHLDARINAGVRDGSLTRAEAAHLRAEFRQLARLEARYRASRGGLDARERADLDQRFDALSARIRYERHDARSGYRGGWWNINERQRELDRRIDAGVRDGSLSLAEAARLRAEFRNLAALEARYRASGGVLDARERRDLNNRFDLLARRIRWERRDWDRR